MSTRQRRWLLVGGIVVFVLAFSLLERLVGPAPVDHDPGEPVGGTASPEPPRLRKLEGGGIEIRHDFFRRSTIRMGDAREEQILFECLERGIAETFGEDTRDWDAVRVREETQLIQNRCVGLPPSPLPVPQPQSNDG